MMTKSLPLAMAAAALLSGCSLGTFEQVDCAYDDECQETFGWGATCGASGFCEEVTPLERCELNVYPEDFYENGAEYADYIPIGILYNSLLTQAQPRAAAIAIQDFRATRYNFAVIECRHNGDPEVVEEVVDFMAGTIGVPAIIGGYDSDSVLTAFSRITENDYDTVFFAPSATSPRVAAAEAQAPSDLNPGRLWRLVPSSDVFGTAMGEYVSSEIDRVYTDTEHTPRVVVLYEDSQDGISLFESVQEAINPEVASDVTVSFFDADTPVGDREAAIRTALEDSHGDEDVDWVVVLSSEPTDYGSALFLTDATENMSGSAHFRDSRFLFSHIGYSGGLEREATFPEGRHFNFVDADEDFPDGVPQIVGIAPYIDTSAANVPYSSFVATFNLNETALTADQSAFTAHSWDAAWMVMYAAVWAKSRGQLTGSTLAQGLRRLQADQEFNVGSSDWSAGYAALTANNNATIDLVGASGPLDYDLSTEELDTEVYPLRLWALVASGAHEDCDDENQAYCIVPFREL